MPQSDPDPNPNAIIPVNIPDADSSGVARALAVPPNTTAILASGTSTPSFNTRDVTMAR